MEGPTALPLSHKRVFERHMAAVRLLAANIPKEKTPTLQGEKEWPTWKLWITNHIQAHGLSEWF